LITLDVAAINFGTSHIGDRRTAIEDAQSRRLRNAIAILKATSVLLDHFLCTATNAMEAHG
jgi:hypothetical protein